MITLTYYDGSKRLFDQQAEYGTYPELYNYKKPDYIFEGWFVDRGLTQKYDGLAVENVFLYAKFAKEPTDPTTLYVAGGIVAVVIGLLAVMVVMRSRHK